MADAPIAEALNTERLPFDTFERPKNRKESKLDSDGSQDLPAYREKVAESTFQSMKRRSSRRWVPRLQVLVILIGVDDVEVDAVEARVEDFLQVRPVFSVVDDLPPLRVPVADLVVAGPVRVFGVQK